ncbi:MAG: hypothetical protein IPN98_05850 [Propionivibrio sp.]|nr:hypothetical protein [Propionivibrio sp.]
MANYPRSDIQEEQDIVERADGSYLVDGSVVIERLKSVINIEGLPGEDEMRSIPWVVW